jgi:hypothetical protein
MIGEMPQKEIIVMKQVDFKKFLKKIFFLPPFFTVIIAAPSFVLVFLVLYMQIGGMTEYIPYVLLAYALVISITVLGKILPNLKKSFWNLKIIKFLKGTKNGQRFFDSVIFRSIISTHWSLAINIAYVVLKVITGIMYKSMWLITFGVYYMLLSGMRGILVHYINKHKIGEDIKAEYIRYRYCGTLLLFMNIVLAGIVVYIVHGNQSINYPGVLICGMALYSFYSITVSNINVLKFRKIGSPVMSATKVISLTASCVSMLSLEVAMLAEFGGDDYVFRKNITSISGAVVCTFVLGMAIYMIIRSTLYLKRNLS